MKYEVKPIRTDVSPNEAELAMTLLQENLERRIKKFGLGKHATPHESLGILMEEVKEVVDAVHANDLEGFVNEMLDVGVTAIWAAASLIQCPSGEPNGEQAT